MRKQIVLILPLVVAMVSIAGIHGFWWLDSAVAQNASMNGSMTNANANGNMTATSGGSAKKHLE